MRTGNWSDERIEALKKLAAQGLSAAKIGAALKTTRDAVMGKCHRESITLSAQWLVWTDDKLIRLRRLWAEGTSTGAIAEIFGTTRKAVREKAKKIGLPIRRAPPDPQRITERKLTFSPTLGLRETVTIEFQPNKADLAIPHAQRRLFLELRSGDCRWPIGEPGNPDFFFCGGEAAPHRPYCAQHCQRAYT